MSIDGAAPSHSHRSHDTGLQGLKFHTRTQVGMMYLKFTNLPNSEVSNSKSIGMRVPNPRFVYTGCSLPIKKGR